MLNAGQDNRPLIFLAASIMAAYLLPYHVYPFQAFYNDWIVILGISVLLVSGARKDRISFQVPWLSIIPLVLSVVIIVQTMHGILQYRLDAVFPIVYLVVAALAIVLGAGFAAASEDSGSIRLCAILAFAHLFAGLISVAIAWCQLVGAEYAPLMMMLPRVTTVRPYANVAQPNQLALLFCVSIGSTWWLYQAGKLWKSIAIAAVALLIFGLTLTQSRIGWLIMPIYALLILFWRQKRGYKVVSARVTIGLLLLYYALVIAFPIITSAAASLGDRVGTSANSERLVLIQQAIKISMLHPWFGAGWYEFGPQQVLIGADFRQTVYAQHSHNIVLNFAAELGWPITILLFGALGWWFYRGCLRRQVSKEVAFAMLFFMAVLVHSSVEFPLWYAYVLLPTALLIGMVHQEQFGSRTIQMSRAWVIGLFFIMAAGLVGTATDYRRVVVGFRALGWENLGLQADDGSTDRPSFTLFPYYYDYFRFAKTKARQGMSGEDIAFMEHVARRFGYAPVMMRMSLIYALNSRPDDAVRSMVTLKKLHHHRYSEAYEAWKNIADAMPEKYLPVFKQFPIPDGAIAKADPA